MHPSEVDSILKTFTVLVDTREKPTEKAKRRLDSMGFPYKSKALKFGDYSCSVVMDGQETSLDNIIAIERKMSLDEISSNLTTHRDRFTREFEKAKESGAKTYIVIENASWDKVYRHDYGTRFNSKAFTASLTAWMARYNCPVVMGIGSVNSGKLIGEILYREAKEYLLRKEVEDEL